MKAKQVRSQIRATETVYSEKSSFLQESQMLLKDKAGVFFLFLSRPNLAEHDPLPNCT